MQQHWSHWLACFDIHGRLQPRQLIRFLNAWGVRNYHTNDLPVWFRGKPKALLQH